MDTLLTQTGDTEGQQGGQAAAQLPSLVVIWSRDAPERVGEVLLPIPPALGGCEAWEFGRELEGPERLNFVRQRPGHNQPTAVLGDGRISRRQLLVRPQDFGLELENLGRRRVLVDGRECKRARVGPGAVVEIDRRLLLLVAERPLVYPALQLPDALVPEFGQPDAFGMVGESPPAWTTRAELAFAAERSVHVLVTGASGTGKELAAQAIHGLSERAEHELVSRNAATFPDTLIDAELFGNARDFPNPGMRERPGLVGSAHRSTLFLDEIGELSHELQAHLLRVLDSGEYQRLGESRSRRADLRLIAATNRALRELKHDFAARLRLRVELPGLKARREDIALLIPALIGRIASQDPKLAARFVEDRGGRSWPRIRADLVRTLVQRPSWSTHVRELEGELWTAMMRSAASGRESIALDEANSQAPAPARSANSNSNSPASSSSAASSKSVEVKPTDLSAADIERALAQAGGVKDRAWRLLGLRNRYQLLRLIKKHGLDG